MRRELLGKLFLSYSYLKGPSTIIPCQYICCVTWYTITCYIAITVYHTVDMRRSRMRRITDCHVRQPACPTPLHTYTLAFAAVGEHLAMSKRHVKMHLQVNPLLFPPADMPHRQNACWLKAGHRCSGIMWAYHTPFTPHVKDSQLKTACFYFTARAENF